MPTVGWIQESASDRYWEAHSQTAVGFRSPPPKYPCTQCGKKFDSADELRRHFHVSHPLELPALYIWRKPLLQESVLRSPIREQEVEIVQCSRCELQVNGGAWANLAVAKVAQELTKPRDATWKLRLIHERAFDNAATKEEYRLRFRIPDEDDLAKVDQLFTETLLVDDLRHADLATFHARLRFPPAANEYGAALGNYVLGILIKEGYAPSNAGVAFERFAESMKEALAVLSAFQRPVAAAVSGCIRFNLNDFSADATYGSAEIDGGLMFFHQIIANETTSLTAQSKAEAAVCRPICPVDEGTHLLLTSCERLRTREQLTLPELQQLTQLLSREKTISEQDLGKLHVICAEGYIRASRRDLAVPHLHAVQFSWPFAEWAQRHLDYV
ncbi:MAG TPA: C2H2-type zinc finger protein [Chthoniobacterales bacterium]|nr:C2H2-type zinc finger protein [Chthoniobacterales bacterium]